MSALATNCTTTLNTVVAMLLLRAVAAVAVKVVAVVELGAVTTVTALANASAVTAGRAAAVAANFFHLATGSTFAKQAFCIYKSWMFLLICYKLSTE